MAKGRVLVGTSGWHYDHWVDAFYPEGTSSGEFLSHYVRRFETAEINNTFYSLPDRKTLVRWRDTVPRRFVFACKASRFITHMKKLKDPRDSLARYVDRVGVLGHTLGPILFQLPPRWHINVERLADFMEVLPSGRRYTFEFRDRSWFEQEVYELLAEHNAALCIYDLDGFRSPLRRTTDFVYVRLHGPGRPYEGSYDGRTLYGLWRRFRNWLEEGCDVYCYFDNDQAGYAALDALKLKEMIQRERGQTA